MSSSHCIVVWEYESGGQWLPHTPGVTRTLERAHAKKLTRVVLADADPALKGHYVNLRTLTQCQDTPDGGTVECHVRRACYAAGGAGGAGGRGGRWEWARLASPPLPAELHYEPMPMELQCAVESAWLGAGAGAAAGAGEAGAVSWRGWALHAARGTARRGAELRVLRRVPQPPYPRHPPHHHPPPAPAPPAAPPTPPARLTHTHTPAPATPGTVPVRRARIPQQHTGSSVHSVHSTISNVSSHSAHSTQSAPGGCRNGARSASPRDRKPGLARQILHNLNIFSHNNKQASPPHGERERERERERESETDEQRTDTECGSTRSGRRHSVDTVSTYLSHESKDSLQRGSVSSVLNCSGGSDDVFDSPPPSSTELHTDHEPTDRGAGAGVVGEGLPGWLGAVVARVPCPQWGALCAVCLQPLGGGGALALRCQHMEHLHCLRHRTQQHQDGSQVECLVCGRALAGSPGPDVELGPLPAPAPAAQPPGSMAWRLHHTSLPQLDTHTSILVTYNFQSGRQGPEQPAPGAPYYAVGFPRHSLLPDTPLGRQVLSALRVAWERRVLFRVCASQTTGREYVVAWSVAPPPAERAHYAPPASPARLLLAALSRLHALLDPHHHHRPPPAPATAR